MARGHRPSRAHELAEVARLADTSTESVRAFFFRPGRLSVGLRQRIADAVAATGYRPGTSTKRLLDGVRVGFQLPRMAPGSTVSPVMSELLQRLVVAVQRAGGLLVPFVVDPPVPPDLDVRGGTAVERESPHLGEGGWVRTYEQSLAPEAYRDVLRKHGVSAFVLGDQRVDDARIAAMAEDGVPIVGLGEVFTRRSSGEAQLDADASFVASDYRAGVAALVQSLTDAGCSRLAHVRFADDGSGVPVSRRAAVLAAMGDQPDLAIHYEDSWTGRPAGALDRFLAEHRPEGVVCDSDELANLVWLAAERVGLQPGRQAGAGRIIVTGVDDAPVRRHRWPSLTLDYEAFMAAVVEILIKQRGSDRGVHQSYVPPVMVGPLGRDPDERLPVPPAQR